MVCTSGNACMVCRDGRLLWLVEASAILNTEYLWLTSPPSRLFFWGLPWICKAMLKH